MQHKMLQDLQHFEQQLGPGLAQANPLSWQRCTKQDDLAHVEQLNQALYDINFHQVFVPVACGGQRQNWLQLWLKVALATRRNINVMPAVMYSIGPMVAIELFANPQQQDQAYTLLSQGEQFCFGLSEPTAGTQLTNVATKATQSADGWTVNGVKGPMGWSKKVTQAIVLAKTGAGGPAALSYVWLPATDDAITVKHFASRGMLGQEFVELHFDNLEVPNDAIVGQVGHGFENTLKVQQLVKYISTAANIGGCHTLLRDVTQYANTPSNGRKLSDYQHVRYLLATATAQLIIAESTILSAGCLLAAKRSQFSVASSVAKHIALANSDNIVAQLRDIISTNFALDASPIHQRFHKIADDLAMVRFIDTNPVANLKNIVTQLPVIRHQHQKITAEKAQAQLSQLLVLLNLEQAYFADEKLKLAITNSQGDMVLNSLLALDDYLQNQSHHHLAALLNSLSTRLSEFWQDFERISDVTDGTTDFANSAQAIELARQYCHLHSCAASLLLYCANPELSLDEPLFAAAQLSVLAPTQLSQNQQEALFTWLCNALEQELAISLVPVGLNE